MFEPRLNRSKDFLDFLSTKRSGMTLLTIDSKIYVVIPGDNYQKLQKNQR
jgi:hypothetical protein